MLGILTYIDFRIPLPEFRSSQNQATVKVWKLKDVNR